MTANAEHSLRHAHRGLNVFQHNPCIVRDLLKPDLLHAIEISMCDHLQKMHEHLDKCNAIWLSVPAYHNLTPKYKSYEEVSQWNGKEMKEISWYLLGVVTQSPSAKCKMVWKL